MPTFALYAGPRSIHEGIVPLTATLIGMDRPDHTRLRRIVNATFTRSPV